MSSVKVSVKDFQSIEKLELDISGFTCVTGPTNIGKSAIIRAVSSAILNKSVVGSVRKGKKFCTVEVDGLKWEKGERVGRYWVPGEVDESGNPKPRDGIGQGQTEVTELMGFRSVKVGDKYINPWLATQFDPIFLMQDSGPAVTDFISDITHLKVLQDAIVHCTRNRQRLLTTVKDREEELSRATAKEAALDGLDNLMRAERDLVQQLESLEEYGRAIARLRKLIAAQESETAAIASLAPARDVRAPRAHVDPSESLMPVARLWTAMEGAAMAISPIKGVAKIVVPDASDSEVVESLRRTARFLSIPSLASSVESLAGAKRVSIPALPEDGIPALRRAAGLHADIESSRRALAVLEREVPPVPEGLPESRLPALAALVSQAGEAEKAIVVMEARAAKVEADLSEVEAELAKIPTCPTCRQVFVQEHAHP